MNEFEKLRDSLGERRKALVRELEMVHTAISRISANA
jgi:hypothetical protein